MFNKVSYRRGVIEGVILYTLGRLGALITPAFFPDWVYVVAPLLFLILQFLVAPFWATRRITSTKRERLSKRFWLLGPRMAAICFCIDLFISLAIGLALFTFEGVQQGPAILRFFTSGPNHLSLLNFGIYELRSAVLLLSFFTLTVICTRLAQGGFFAFTACGQARTAHLVLRPVAAERYGAVQGHVLDRQTGRPIAGTTLSVQSVSVVTDASGFYSAPRV